GARSVAECGGGGAALENRTRAADARGDARAPAAARGPAARTTARVPASDGRMRGQRGGQCRNVSADLERRGAAAGLAGMAGGGAGRNIRGVGGGTACAGWPALVAAGQRSGGCRKFPGGLPWLMATCN